MGYRNIFAVGDMHGNFSKFKKLWAQMNFDGTKDFVVFLGDYIDRGENPLDCLRFVKNLKKDFPDNVVTLKGNHEFMMEDFLKNKKNNPYDIWLTNGGDKTFHELNSTSRDEAAELIDFVKNLPHIYCMEDFVFVHAGIDPDIPLDNALLPTAKNIETFLWGKNYQRDYFLNHYKGDKTVIVGHTPTQAYDTKNGGYTLDYTQNKPQFLKNHIIMCDTGSYLDGGRISCVDVKTMDFFQS